MSSGRPWSDAAIRELRRLAEECHCTDAEIAERLFRDRADVGRMRRHLGISAGLTAGMKAALARVNVRRLHRVVS